MRMVARYMVELDGHVYRKGEVCEYGGEITDRIRSNFEFEEKVEKLKGSKVERSKGPKGERVKG